MIYKRKTTMNLRKNITYLFFSFLSLLAVTACSDEDDAVIAGGKDTCSYVCLPRVPHVP